MKFFKKLFNEAIRQELIERDINPFDKYRIKDSKPQRTYLTKEELFRIEALTIEDNAKLDLHRDMFVFACYVGGL